MSIKKEAELDIKEIVFCNEEEKSFCDVFVYEPENVDEQELGSLYIIGEVVNLSENSSYLINLLASVIKKEFYSNHKRSTMESMEASLHKANSILSSFAEQGNVDWVGNLNVICGAYNKNKLYFSQVGSTKTLLIRDSQITDIGKNISQKEKPHPFKTFSNIASGEIEKNDLILFSTPEFFNIFSLEKIRQLSSSLDLEDLVEVFQDTIEQEEDISSVGLIAIKTKSKINKEEKEFDEKEFESTVEKEEEKIETENEDEKKEEDVVSPKENSKEDRKDSELEKTEEQEDIVSNEFLNRKKITLDEIIKKYEKTKEEQIKKEVKEDIKPDREPEIKITVEQEIGEEPEKKEKTENREEDKELAARDPKTFLKILDKIFISSKNKLSNQVEKYIQKGDNHSDGKFDEKKEKELLQKISLPSRKNKLVLVAIIFIFMLFAANLIFTGYKKETEENFNFYNDKIIQAREKIGKIEEVMIYNDLEQARVLLADAKNLATEVKNNYDKLDTEADGLLNEIQQQLDKIDFVNRIENPEVAVDLEQAGVSSPKQLTLMDKNFYLLDSSNAVYEINPTNKKATGLSNKTDDIASFEMAIPIEKTNEIIFFSADNNARALNLNKKESSVFNVEFVNDNPEIKNISSYGDYLYFLEPNENQIYKYRRAAANISSGKEWITDKKSDLSKATYLAIDGHIYVLKSDGTVDKYLSGTKVDFVLEKLSEPISPSAKIYANADLEYLYVIDPPQQRIILFNKTNGNLIGQYTSNAFADLKNIAVDNMESKMYILSGNKIFAVKIEKE